MVFDVRGIMEQLLVVNNILMRSFGPKNQSLNKNTILPSQKPYSNRENYFSQTSSGQTSRKMSNVSTLSGSLAETNAKPINESQSENKGCLVTSKNDLTKKLGWDQRSKKSSLHSINNKINVILGHWGDSNNRFKRNISDKQPKDLSQEITIDLERKDDKKLLSRKEQSRCPKKRIVRKDKSNSTYDGDRCLTDISNNYLNCKDLHQDQEYRFDERALKTEELVESVRSVKISSSILDSHITQLQQSAKNNQFILRSLQKEYLTEKPMPQYFPAQEVRRPRILSKINSELTNNTEFSKKSMGRQSQRQRLARALNKQIILDERFNNAKAWFKSYRKQHKWWLLERQLKKHKLWIHQLGMKALFSINNSKENPFQPPHQDQYTIKALVQSYQQAEQHWLEKITNSFDCKLLKEVGFTEESLDFCRKGYVSIQDLTRFVNIELRTFYHIRQLELIFLRFKNSQYLQFFDILQAISKVRK